MKNLCLAILFSLASSWINTAYSQAIIAISNGSGKLGSQIDIPVTISGLGNHTAPSLGTFDLNISFDPVILKFSSVSFGDPILGNQLDLDASGDNPTFDGLVSPGVLNLFDLSLDDPNTLNALQAPEFTLATLTFDAIGLGTSFLNLSTNDALLGDALGNSLPVVTIFNGRITVPAPSTLALFGIGALGMLGYSRRRPTSSPLKVTASR